VRDATPTLRDPAILIARLDRLPVWPYRRAIIVVIGISYLFAFFDVSTFGYALPVLVGQLHSTLAALSVALTTNLVGYIVGAYFIGTMSDVVGRRPAFVLAAVLVSVGSLVTAFAMNAVWLDVWRFVTGVGIGAEISLAATYLGEIAPRAVRAKYNGWANVWAIGGLSLVPFVALGLVPHFQWGWRVLFVLGALGGVAALVSSRVLPESPRWLVVKGRVAEAETVVVAAETLAAQRWPRPLPEPEPTETVAPGSRFPTRDLLRRPYRGRLVFWIVAWFFTYVATYGWLGLGPSLLEQHGYTLTSTYIYLVLSVLGGMTGVLVCTLVLVDRFDRKVIVCGAIMVWALGMLMIGLAPGHVMVAVGAILTAVGMNSTTSVIYLYTAEHFPTRARTTGTALTDGLGHVGGALASVLVLGAYKLAGFSGAFVFQAACLVVAMALLGRFGLRIRERSLDSLAS
jgi:MFS transporter, putative metabolite:H+ symporter